MKQVCLLTGKPGTGKTSLIKQAVASLEASAGGFYTEEIRLNRVRQGFRLVTLDGQVAILAHINIQSPYRVSKYGVDITSLDKGITPCGEAGEFHTIVVDGPIFKKRLDLTKTEIVSRGEHHFLEILKTELKPKQEVN